MYVLPTHPEVGPRRDEQAKVPVRSDLGSRDEWEVENKNPLSDEAERVNDGGQTRNRTEDTRIFSPLLYQLSYLAKSGVANKGWRLGRVNGKFAES